MSALLICQAIGMPLEGIQGLKVTSSMRGQAWIVPTTSNGKCQAENGNIERVAAHSQANS